MRLKEIAHSRTGDKGNISNISVIVYDDKDYDFVKEKLTVNVVKEWFSEIVRGDVVRYELPKIHAFNFVMNDALSGGVTRALTIDKHGKSLSSILLEIDL